MSGHGVNLFFFNKKKLDAQNTSYTSPTPPPPLHPITSHFYLTTPSPAPLKVDVISVSPLYILYKKWVVKFQLFRRNKMTGIPVKNQGKKPHGFLKESQTNSCEITRINLKI